MQQLSINLALMSGLVNWLSNILGSLLLYKHKMEQCWDALFFLCSLGVEK